MEYTWTKLQSGEYGVRAYGKDAAHLAKGKKVTVKRKDGSTSEETLAQQVSINGTAAIWTIEKKARSGTSNGSRPNTYSDPNDGYKSHRGPRLGYRREGLCGAKGICPHGEDASSFCRQFGSCQLADC